MVWWPYLQNTLLLTHFLPGVASLRACWRRQELFYDKYKIQHHLIIVIRQEHLADNVICFLRSIWFVHVPVHGYLVAELEAPQKLFSSSIRSLWETWCLLCLCSSFLPYLASRQVEKILFNNFSHLFCYAMSKMLLRTNLYMNCHQVLRMDSSAMSALALIPAVASMTLTIGASLNTPPLFYNLEIPQKENHTCRWYCNNIV